MIFDQHNIADIEVLIDATGSTEKRIFVDKREQWYLFNEPSRDQSMSAE